LTGSNKSSGGKEAKKSNKVGKRSKGDDPELVKAVEQVVASMEITGGYRKPTIEDVLAYQLCLIPMKLGKAIYFNLQWHYRHT